MVDVATLAVAAGIAFWAWRRRDRVTDATVFWLVGLVYCLRFFYPSLYPYYVAPALAIFCAAGAIHRAPRFTVTLLLGGAMTWWTGFVDVDGRWLFWIGIGYPLAVMALAAFPPQWARRPAPPAPDPTLEPAPVPDATIAAPV
jgi:4-amino-4-deoxy-L-arabinose transferase-like glycosyltransferase